MAETVVNYTIFPDYVVRNNVVGGNTSTNSNYINMMDDNSIDTLCDGAGPNSSMCDKKGLGINLSTPILMLSFGVLGNIIAIIVLFTVRNEMKRTVFYTFLCGLAWTDLTGQVLTGPIAIIVYANNLQWVGGEPVCKYHAFAMICFGIITPLLVCCMSLERVLALRFPYFHARTVTKKKARIVILCCFLFVLSFSCLPFFGFGSYQHQFPGSWCFLNFHRESTSDVAYAYTYAFINVLIISVIIIGNTLVMLTLVKMRKARQINSSPSVNRRNGVKGKTKIKMEEETHMVWFLCAITVVFTVCWFPLNIHILINQVTGRVNYAADLIGVRMASINQILDPWLYILLRKSVIVKTLKFAKNFLFRDKNHASPKRSTRYVTNYSNNYNGKVDGTASVKDKDVLQLSQFDRNIINVKECDMDKDNLSETSESSGADLDEAETEKNNLTGTSNMPQVSGPRFAYKRCSSYGSAGIPNDNTPVSQMHPSLTNRKASLPARLTYGS